MKPTRGEYITVAVIWLVVGGYFAVKHAPIPHERVEGAAKAWADCPGTPEEKRAMAKQVDAKVCQSVAEYLEQDGKLSSPKYTTAQQAARLRFEHAKNALAGTGFCNKGCRFQPVAEVATEYLARHLGVAKDYKLDEPFPGKTERTGRQQFVIVLRNLGLGLVESAP